VSGTQAAFISVLHARSAYLVGETNGRLARGNEMSELAIGVGEEIERRMYKMAAEIVVQVGRLIRNAVWFFIAGWVALKLYHRWF